MFYDIHNDSSRTGKNKINKSVQYQFLPLLALFLHISVTKHLKGGGGPERGLAQLISYTATKAQSHAVCKGKLARCQFSHAPLNQK